MKFLYPNWLWGLAFIVPLMAMLFWDERLRKLRFTRFAAEATWKILAPDLDFSARIRKGVVWLFSFAFILVALARPQWGTHEETSKLSGLDVMLVLDISNSMQVEDIIPNRLQKAKHEIRSLVEHLQGDRVGVVAFAASAQVSCPLTTDLSYLLDTVQILNPQLASSQGTDIGLGLETARKSIERGSEDSNTPPGVEAQQSPQSSQAIILISDGEDQEDSATEVAKKLRETGVKFYAIGVGSQKGGPIPIRDENGNLVGYKKDRHQKSVVSQFKPDALMQLAAAAGGRYWSATDNENEVEEIIQDLGGMHRAEFAERRYVVFEDRFQYPLFVAVLLMFIEMVLPTRKKSQASAAFMILLAVISSLGTPQRAEAAPLKAYLENEKGIESLKDGKVDDAKREFGTAQAVAPDLPELEFNQGVVQLNQGDADAAIQSFGEATRKSLGKDPAFASKSLFNLGVAQTKKGDFKSAVKSYLAAIEQSDQAPSKSDAKKVGSEARKNLELLNQEQKKQQQQKKQDQDKKDQEQKQQQQQQDQKKDQQDKQDKQKKDQQKNQDKDKKDNSDQKDQKDKDKSQEQSKPGNEQYDDPKNQQFKSQKLTPDDADRVMEELKHREKELQTKLKQKKTNTQDSVNDW